MNSTGRLGEASVKYQFRFSHRPTIYLPTSALAYRTYPVPCILILHVFTQLLSPLLYYMYMLLWICKSTWDSPPETVLSRRLMSSGVYFGFVTILVKYESDMARKTYPSPPPSPGPFNASADRYADWKSLMKLACTAFSVERPRNWLFLQNGHGGRLYSASGFLLRLGRPMAVLAIPIRIRITA